MTNFQNQSNPSHGNWWGLLALIVLLPTVAFAQGRSPDRAGTGTKGPADRQPPGLGIFDRMPARPANLPVADKARVPFRVPEDPDFEPDPSFFDSPPTDGPLGSEEDDNLGKANAPGDYVAFLNSNVDVDSGPNNTSDVDEPSLGQNGRVVFYTGNWFAGFSGDGGQNFQFVDPYDNFPADGTADVPANSGGFCCDQVVHYEPSRGLMIWFLQYLKSGENPNVDSNVFRIAIANSQADVLNNNWFWWTFDPADFNLPATGVWFDYPDLAFTNEYLYMTTNVFNIVAPSTGNPTGADSYNTSLIVRFPLDEIADAGNLPYRWWNRSGRTLRPIQNATTRMYVARHEDSNTLRIYDVGDSETSLGSTDVDYNGYNRLVDPSSSVNDVMNAAGPDGTNFAGRADSRILAAWRSATSSEIGFMWNADESDGTGDVTGSRPFPYIKAIRIRTSDFAVQEEEDIWNSGYAWMYPSINVNDRGHLGGTMANGGGTRHPRSYAWIIDDYNSPAFPSLNDFDLHAFATGNDGPNDNEWGDYLTTRKMVPYGNTWVGTGFRLTGGGDEGDVVPEFIWFGRERDMPPTANTIYVDLSNTSGYETGALANPYNTAEEGETALQPGDDLRIRTGTYNEGVLFDTQAEVNNYNGTAIIVAGGPEANSEARLRATESEEDAVADPADDEREDASNEQ